MRVQLQRELLQFANVVFRLLQPEREPAVALLEALLVLVHMPRIQGPGDEQARRDEDQHEGENKTRMLASSRGRLIWRSPLAAALLAMREGKGRLRVRVAAMRKPQPGLRAQAQVRQREASRSGPARTQRQRMHRRNRHLEISDQTNACVLLSALAHWSSHLVAHTLHLPMHFRSLVSRFRGLLLFPENVSRQFGRPPHSLFEAPWRVRRRRAR